ncbi:OFA family MFS transporter [soil metagenome]
MKEPPYAWVVVWGTFFALAVIFGVSYSFAALFESFSAEFAARRADVAMVFGLSGLIYFLLGAGAGMLADRFGPRVVCCSGMLCIAGGLLATSFAQSMAMVYLAYGAGVGIGIALVYTPSIACVQPWFTQRRGLAAGLASAGIGAGTVVVPLLAARAIAALEWRGALRVMALGVLVTGLAATFSLKRAPSASNASKAGVPGATLRQALHTPRFWWMYLATVAAGPVMFIPFAHASAAARDLGITESRAVGLVGLIGVGSVIGRFAIGALADKLGRTFTLALMQGSMGASFLLWQSAGVLSGFLSPDASSGLLAGGYVPLAIFALWFGLSYGGIVSLMPAICMDMFGARAVSSIIGTLYTGAALGNLLGPVIAGAVFDRTHSYAPVIWGCVALAAVAALASAKVASLSRVAAY